MSNKVSREVEQLKPVLVEIITNDENERAVYINGDLYDHIIVDSTQDINDQLDRLCAVVHKYGVDSFDWPDIPGFESMG